MKKIPLMVDLSDKSIVIIGGGKIAERRVKRLYNHCSSLTIISPEITSGLNKLTMRENITWLKKQISPDDLACHDLIIIATNNDTVNQMVLTNAPADAWINACHDSEKGNIDFPVTVERGKLQISISTGASSPFLAKKIKEELQNTYTVSYESYVDFLFQVRGLVKNSPLPDEQKHHILYSVVEEPIFNSKEQAAFLLKLKEQM
ncbi:precorrin-2 dehydrogenase / sirohydrochlorin ferrochelatase [Gracilibacillus ureilyticus]|uniref:precorrin-2 dehydrogenase n=1 Tax=Gracilibacillus ureilyticus TaxID=531814 RepID=A0A1H9TNR2_9BACI|nr:NAD(P)-binding protein [Gracilibacillus ureilyticus]SER98806.1 precorrin-2 dehydrogenase / sirohydrochlorin ferrochelatase [Gracilibacillus ureilyticus]